MFGKKQLKTKLYLIYFSFDKNPDYDDFLNLLEFMIHVCVKAKISQFRFPKNILRSCESKS